MLGHYSLVSFGRQTMCFIVDIGHIIGIFKEPMLYTSNSIT